MRDLRVTYDTRHIGASLNDGELSLWKTSTLAKIATARTGFSGGSQRYAFDPVNGVVYSGAWEDGLACVDYHDGKTLWHREDLIGVQMAHISSAFPASLFVAIEARDHRVDEPDIMTGVMELDASTGETVWANTEWNEVFVHPFKPVILAIEKSARRIHMLDERKNSLGWAPLTNFAVIDVAFSADMIALAEGEKGVRTMSFYGEVISKYLPPRRKPNCVSIAFAGEEVVVFDEWSASYVTQIDPLSGKMISEYERGEHGVVSFIDEGSRFVDSEGDVFRTADGERVGALSPADQRL